MPAVAWWAAGISDADQRAQRIESELRLDAARQAREGAAAVTSALARVADLETRRPWRHYRSAQAMQEPPWRADPLVIAHFEIAPRGAARVTELGDFPDPEASPPILCALRDDLAARVPDIWRAVTPECAAGPPMEPASGDDVRATCIGPLTWTTLALGSSPSLVALRHVEHADGMLTQGLVIDAAAPHRVAAGSSLAVLRPGPPPGDLAAPVHVVGTAWHVAVDDAPLALAARDRAGDLRAAFVHAFALGLSVAALAGLAAIVLAWQAFRLSRRRAELTAITAHELRTPLAGIRLHAGMLASGLGDPAKAQARAQRVSIEAWRLSRVVHNLLDDAARGMAVRAEAGDLRETLRSAITTIEAALQAGGAAVELGVPGDLPPAEFDAEATARIVHDLLDNAEKHGRGSTDRLIRVEARADAARGIIEVSVDDAGPGIPERDRRRAFRPFARLGAAGAPSGLGLGLALARRRAHAMRGDLRCETSERGGARLVLSLPLAARGDQSR